MISPDEKALIILTAGTTTKNLNDHVSEQLKNLSKFNVLQEGFSSINGLRAFYKFVSTSLEDDDGGETEKQDVNVRFTSIKKGNNVINFLAAAPVNDYPSHKNQMLSTIRSFNNLTDMKYLRRKPNRIVLREVSKQRTLSNLLQALRVPRNLWERIALLNAVRLDTLLSPKSLVKVIQ
jgi:predicted Zn-dependent protease